MKCAIFKTVDGGAIVGQICDESGNILSPNIEEHLNCVLTERDDLVSWRITDHKNLPGGGGNDGYDCTFKDAFTDEIEGEQVDIDLPKAVDVAHKIRRAKRSEEFNLVDGDNMFLVVNAEGEEKRKDIRLRYAQHQIDIDACDCVEALSELVS